MNPARQHGQIAPATALALFVASAPYASAQTEDAGSAMGSVTLALAGVGAVAGIVGIVLALRASKLAANASEEAGAARARAAQGSGNLTPESLAAVERVWGAKFAALEAQLQGSGRGGGTGTLTRPPTRGENGGAPATAGGDLSTRLIELEKTVAGLSVQVHAGKGKTAAPAAAAETAWPACISADTSAMQDVRSALAQALKAKEPTAKEVLDKLRAADGWASSKPGSSELATTLVDISSLLLTALRKGASVAPLDGALLSDRVLAAVRPLWRPLHPSIDCRSFYPGATFDPDWMEDHTRAGLRRPVISEMLSWAVFEKGDNSRRLLAKARVTAD